MGSDSRPAYAPQRFFIQKDLRAVLYDLGYRSYFLDKRLVEFGLETSIKGLANILFKKTPTGSAPFL